MFSLYITNSLGTDCRLWPFLYLGIIFLFMPSQPLPGDHGALHHIEADSWSDAWIKPGSALPKPVILMNVLIFSLPLFSHL